MSRPAASQKHNITIDNSFGAPQALTGPNYGITANLGKQVGGNLFHSFGKFGLDTGESAAFSGPASVNNVIGRVTGGSLSSIDGRIQSNIAGANLYLINPNGVVFGPHATVNVSGGFHASTADYIKMSDGARFQATNPSGSTLSAAPPVAFGFLTAKPAAISVNGSNLGPVPGTLGVVGGPVSINSAATLTAPGGTIHVTSAAGTGEVPVDPRSTAALTVTNFGPVDIKGASKLDVGNPGGLGPGGSVFVHAGALTISASELGADNYGSAEGGVIALRGESQVVLTGGSYLHALTVTGSGAGIAISTAPSGTVLADDSTVLTGSAGPGNAGPLAVSTGQLTLTNGAILGSLAAGSGKGGDISIGVSDQLLIDGSSGPALTAGIPATGIASTTLAATPTGSAGNITISAGSLIILSKGGIASSTFGSANSGNISVKVAGQLAIDQSTATDIKPDVILGIESQANPASSGNAGNVAITAGSLTITGAGQLGSPTFGAGNGGDVSVNVAGLLTIDGSQAIGPFFTGIGASVQPGSSGDAGSIIVNAGQLSILDGLIFNGTVGMVGSTPASTGNAGNITVKVTGALTIDGAGSPFSSGIVASTDVGTRGNAGDVVVNAGSLSITNSGSIEASTAGAGHGASVTVVANSLSLTSGGIISSGTSGAGNAGNVMVAAETLSLDSGALITSATFGSRDAGSVSVNVAGLLSIDGRSTASLTGISSDAERGTGNAGTVTVTAGTASIINNGQIGSGTFGAGNGGTVTVGVAGQLLIDAAGASGSGLTGIAAQANPGSTGNAGSVLVNAETISLRNGGVISSGALGTGNRLAASTGNAGNVTVSVAGLLSIDGGSGIATDTDPGTIGKAGNVIVNAGALQLGDFGRISSETAGRGDGGNVIVNAGTLTVSPNGQITTDTFASGIGGNIAVTVTGALSIDGTASTVPTGITALTSATKNAGNVHVSAGTLSIRTDGLISTDTFATGRGGNIDVTVAGALSVDGTASTVPTGITALTGSSGNAGNITVSAGSLNIVRDGLISVDTLGGTGSAGSVTVNVAGALSIDGTGQSLGTGISSESGFSTGNSGEVRVSAGSLMLSNGGQISASTFGAGAGGDVQVNAGVLVLTTGGEISASTFADGRGGNVRVSGNSLTITQDGAVSASTFGKGAGGGVAAAIAGPISIDGTAQSFGTGITSASGIGGGNAGQVTVGAGSLTIVNGGEISTSTRSKGAGGDIMVNLAGDLTIDGVGSPGTSTPTAIIARTLDLDGGNAGRITVNARNISILDSGVVSTSTFGAGAAGQVLVNASGKLVIDGANTPGFVTGIASSANLGLGNAGQVAVNTGELSIAHGGEIQSLTFEMGNGGDVTVNAQGRVTIDGSGGQLPTGLLTNAQPGSTGRAGAVTLSGQDIVMTAGGLVSSGTAGQGNGGTVEVVARGSLGLSGAGTGIIASASSTASGDAGSVTVGASQIAVTAGAEISSTTAGTGAGGSVAVTTPGAVLLDGAGVSGTQIAASATGLQSGPGGSADVAADSLTIQGGARIAATTAGPGKGGDITVITVNGANLSGTGPDGVSGITASAEIGSTGNAGEVLLMAGGAIALADGAKVTSSTAGAGSGGTIRITDRAPLSLSGAGTGIIASATSSASGNAGSVLVTAPQIAIAGGAEISSTTAGLGTGGSVAVMTPGALVLDGAGLFGTQIAASATGPRSGPGGSVNVAADSLTIQGGARIAASTAGPGKGGDVDVAVTNGVNLSGTGPDGASSITASAEPGSSGPAGEVMLAAGGAVALAAGARVASSTAGNGDAGTVRVSSQGPLSLTGPGSGILVSATSTASGSAGSVTVTAPQIALVAGAEISSTTAGTGAGGSVNVTTPGRLVLDGAGTADTQIAASATGRQSGPGGSVTVAADALTIEGGAHIASTTFGPGKAGDIGVTVAHDVTLSGSGPNGASGITASAEEGSSGRAGEVVLVAGGAISLAEGARVTSSTAGAGAGGTVQVTGGGPLTLTDPGTGIIASATATASGDAGSVTVGAPQITITTGAEISSTTAGTGAGGSVAVTTPGALALNGGGNPGTQIAASAVGPQSGPGGSVTVSANSLVVQGGAQIASSTAGPGKGGDVDVAVASDIVLPDRGPQITARSTGSGDAGSITVSAVRLLMRNGAAISTEAETSTASGGNITLHVNDFLYLVNSGVTTSVKGETGNGGNIAIDPQLVILDHSSLVAQAIEGHGGNITITAGQFIPSSDSIVSATSQLGISGTIEINGPRVDVNGALVVLSSELRGRTAVLREACAARSDRPISSLVDAGRGGLPQDPEASLPALYIAGRDLSSNPTPGAGPIEADNSVVQTAARLTIRCGG